MSDIERLRVMLGKADSVAAVKRIYDQACGLAKEAATARNFALLDEFTAERLKCSRKGGALLLAGADRVPGVDVELWSKRAEMDDATFAAVVRKAQAMQRRNAGEAPPSQDARCRDHETLPQAKTLLSSWRIDEFGNAMRYVVGVDLKCYRQLIAAGRDPQKVEAALLREALAASSNAGGGT